MSLPPARRWHFEISPTFHHAPAVLEIVYGPRDYECMWLWLVCGSWISGAEVSSRRGFVPANLPDHIEARSRGVSRLIEHGLWDFAQDDDGQLGYQMGYEGELWRMLRARTFLPGRGAWIEPSRRTALYERDGWACRVCGSLDRLSLDHKLPRIRGGGHDDANLWTLCRSCNSRKGTKTVEEWLGAALSGA